MYIPCSTLESGRFCIDMSLSEACMDTHIWLIISILELDLSNAESNMTCCNQNLI